MPPKAVKKTPTGSATKRGGRTARGTPKSQGNQPVVVADEPVKVEVSAVVEEKKKVEVKQESKPVADRKAEPEKPVKSVENRVVAEKKDDVKESVDEYEKGERLDLEDNDPEFEPEEYGGVDYDERGIEHEDVQEEDYEIEEDPQEGDDGEEEGDDMVEEHEEIEGEEENERASGEEHEHAEMVDAAEDAEHHEVAKERLKRKEFEIFIGGLDKDAVEDDLRKIFSQVGEVTEVRLLMNPLTKKNKGFAFLRFATVEQAKRACIELKNPVVNGKKCGVSPSQDSDTLFLGNICKSWTKEALKEKLKHYGIDNVEDLTLVEDTNNEGMNRGFAFLEFPSRSEAMDAFKRLQKRDIVFGVDKLPLWLSQHDLNYYSTKFDQKGFTGGLNYYRALDLNWELTAPWTGVKVNVPVKFVVGDLDVVYTTPGIKEYVHGGGFKKDVPMLEDVVVLEGAAHFINQERAQETNSHIYDFINKF